MYRGEFAAQWPQLKGKIQEKWVKLTNDDVVKINGKYESLIAQLQKKYGFTKEQAEKDVQSWQEVHSKEARQLSSEETPAERLTQNELVHEDRDPIYPLDSGKTERAKGQDFKEKKRKRFAR